MTCGAEAEGMDVGLGDRCLWNALALQPRFCPAPSALFSGSTEGTSSSFVRFSLSLLFKVCCLGKLAIALLDGYGLSAGLLDRRLSSGGPLSCMSPIRAVATSGKSWFLLNPFLSELNIDRLLGSFCGAAPAICVGSVSMATMSSSAASS